MNGMYERVDVNVRILVEVDGHLLRFEQDGKATGARYHGEVVTPLSFALGELERGIRGTVDTCIARATKDATTACARLYPLAEDRA
jgi:hypothetical protein